MLHYEDLDFQYINLTKFHIIIFLILYIFGVFLSFNSKLNEHQNRKAVIEALLWPIIWFIIWPIKQIFNMIFTLMSNLIKMFKIMFGKNN